MVAYFKTKPFESDGSQEKGVTRINTSWKQQRKHFFACKSYTMTILCHYDHMTIVTPSYSCCRLMVSPDRFGRFLGSYRSYYLCTASLIARQPGVARKGIDDDLIRHVWWLSLADIPSISAQRYGVILPSLLTVNRNSKRRGRVMETWWAVPF